MKNNAPTSSLRAWSCIMVTLALCAGQACGPNGERTLCMNAPEDQKRQPLASKQPIVNMIPDSAPTGGPTSTKRPSARGKRKGHPIPSAQLPLSKNPRTRSLVGSSSPWIYPSLLRRYGFRAKAIEADGNCLFRAVADQLISRLGINFPAHVVPYMVLKHIAADHVQQFSPLYAPFLAPRYPSVPQLAIALRRDGEWAGDEALSALSRALQLPIVVVQDQYAPPIHIYKPSHAQRRAIYLYYTNHVHYESLYEANITGARQVVARQLDMQHSDEDFIPATISDIQSTINEMAGRMGTAMDLAAKHTEYVSVLLSQKLRAHYQARYATTCSPFDSTMAYPVQQIKPQLAVIAPAHDIRQKHTVTLGGIFWRQSAQEEVAVRVRNVLLIGQAGIGKTTLTHKLAYLWATGQWEEDTFESVYVLPVAKLHPTRYDGKSLRTQANLATAIARECYRAAALSDDEFTQLTEAITYQLKHYPGKVLLIVDGLEQRHEASETILQQLEQCAPQTYQLRTARCDEVSDEQKVLMGGRDGVVIACNAMTYAQRNSYVAHPFQDTDAKASSKLLRFLKEHSALNRLSLTPAHLQLLCFLWKKDDKAVIRETRQGSLTSLYRLLAQCVLRDYAAQGASSAEAIRKAQALYQQTVEQLALFEFAQDKPWNLYTGGNLETMLQEVKVCKEFLMTDRRLYDYFLGSALARMFLNEKKHSEVMRFLQASKYQKQYQQILTLMAGTLYEQEGTAGLAQLLEAFDKGTCQEAMGLQHLLLQLRCVNECIGLAKNEEAVKSLQAQYALLTNQLYAWAQQGLAQLRSRSTDNQLHETLLQAFAELGHVVADSKLCGLYTTALQDPVPNTFDAALRALAVLAPISTQCANTMLDILLKMGREATPPLRQRAIVALGTLGGYVPDRVQEVFAALLQLLPRNSAIGDTIGQACVQLMAAVPEQGLAVQKTFLQGSIIPPGNDIALRIREIFSSLVEANPSHDIYCRLLPHCASSYTGLRIMAIQALGALVQAWPHCAGDIVQTVLAAMQSADRQVHPCILETLESCVIAISRAHNRSQVALQGNEQKQSSGLSTTQTIQPLSPALLLQMWNVALKVSTDADALIRERAADLLQALADHMSPQLAAQVLPNVVAMTQIQDEEACLVAIPILPQLAQVNPDIMLRVLPVLTEMCSVSQSCIRASGMAAIAACLNINTTLVLLEVWPTLSLATQDRCPHVQHLAIAAFKDIATAVPKACVQPICERLLRKLKYTAAPDTCVSALEALEEYIEIMEEDTSKALLTMLLTIYKDRNVQIRQAAIHTLGTLASSIPAYLPTVLPILVQACRDSAPAVRCYALRALERSAAITYNQASFEAVISACTDPSPLVRVAAGKALQQIHKNATSHVLQALGPLLIMSTDGDRSVQANAHNALMRYSTRYFIEQYCQYSVLQDRLLPCALWRTVNAYVGPPLVHELFLAHIRTRLQKMSLVIDNRQLTLYPSASRRITWSMPEAEVKVLREAVREQKSKDGEST